MILYIIISTYIHTDAPFLQLQTMNSSIFTMSAAAAGTVGDVLSGKALSKMLEDGEWLGRPATLVTLAVAVATRGCSLPW